MLCLIAMIHTYIQLGTVFIVIGITISIVVFLNKDTFTCSYICFENSLMCIHIRVSYTFYSLYLAR